ncbi:MAG: efflux RND transporter periplasmic adaptor subunit [Clostridiales bacterium]|nr:efflux RND transporter periplasmic adaptor subunit [Clostridiales bacterium]
MTIMKTVSKKKKIISITIIAILLIIGYMAVKKINNAKAILLDEDIALEYTLVLKDISQTYSTSGSVSSKVDKIIKSPFSSESVDFIVEVGDEINKGDVIAVFDDSDVKVSLLLQEKTVLNLESQLNQIMDEGNKSYLSSMESARIAYESAKAAYDQNLLLYETGGISLRELDASEDEMGNAYNNYDYNRSKYYGYNLETEVKILEKSLEVERINLAQLQNDYENIEMKSEIHGTIVALYAESGDSISQGQNIYEIMDLNSLEVISQISEYEINQIEEGQEVIITVSGNNGIQSKGIVRQIYPSADSSGSEVSVVTVIDIINPDPILKPGFSANLEILIDSKKEAKVVPYDALINTPKGYSIIKIVDGEEIVIPVETGVESDLMIEIISDQISEGDIIKVISTVDFTTMKQNDGMFVPGAGKPGTIIKK